MQPSFKPKEGKEDSGINSAGNDEDGKGSGGSKALTKIARFTLSQTPRQGGR